MNENTIKKILKDLEIVIKEENNNGLLLSIPPFKVDVTREADVIEEILRIYGYNNIDYSGQLKSSLSFTPKPDPEKLQNMISDQLTASGFNEVMNNSLSNSKYIETSKTFNAENNVVMLNPISSDLNIMRQSLIFGMLESVSYNVNRKNENIKFYEFGRSYQKGETNHNHPLSKYHEETHLVLTVSGKKSPESWANKEEEVDIYFLKAHVQNIFTKLGIPNNNLTIKEETSEDFDFGMSISADNKTLAFLGRINQKMRNAFDIKQKVFYADINWNQLIKQAAKTEVQYKEIPKYPAVRRDLALLVDKSVKFDEIEKIAYKTERKLLKSVNLFDIYEGKNIEEGKKSYAVSFLLQDTLKTLTDKIIDKTMNRMLNAYKREINAGIR